MSLTAAERLARAAAALEWRGSRLRALLAAVMGCATIRRSVVAYVTPSGASAAAVHGFGRDGRCRAVVGRGGAVARADVGDGVLWVALRRAGRAVAATAVLLPRRGRPAALHALCDAWTGECVPADAF